MARLFWLALSVSVWLAQQPARGQSDRPADLLDIVAPSESLVASTRLAWATALSPDETWVAVSYGHWANGDAGQVRVWDIKTGETRWHAREPRGVRAVAVSPDGTLVASGNFGGEIRLRDSATGQVKQELRETAGSVERLAFSSDGRRIATSSNGRAVRIWDLATGDVVRSFDGHAQNVYWVELSPDDKLIATASQDKTVRIWNVSDGTVKHSLAHGGEVNAAIFVSGGKQLATVSHDGLVRIWNVETGKVDLSLPVPEPRMAAVALSQSKNGKFLATGNYQQLNVWNTSDWSLHATLPGHQQLAWGAAVTNDGTRLVSSGWENVVKVWDVPRQAELHALPLPPDERDAAGPIRTLAVSPDGSLLAVSCQDVLVLLRDRATGKIVRTLAGPEGVITSIAFSPDGLSLAAASADKRGHVWDVKSGELKGKTGGHEGGATCLTWSTSGRLIATGGNDNALRVWDAKTLKEVATFEEHPSAPLCVAISPDDLRVVSCGDDGVVRVWDVAKRVPLATLTGHVGAVRAVAASADTIASGGEDKVVKLWDAATLKQRASVGGHGNAVSCLAFSPGGKTLASGSVGGGFLLIDPVRGIVRNRQTGHGGAITGLAFLADGSGLVSASDDQSIRLWRAAPPPIEPLVTLPAHAPEAHAARFSPDGKYLATGGKDGLISLRDPRTGEIRRTLKGHRGIVYEIAFPPDSAVLASAGSDGTVRLWSVERGIELAKFNVWKEKLAAARSVDFHKSGDLLAAGGWDGTLILWDVNTLKIKKSLIGQALPVTSVRFSPDGSILATSTGDWQQWQVKGDLRLWDAKTGEELASLEGHTTEIKRLEFDHDGRRLASSGAGGQVFVWDVAARSLIGRIRNEGAGNSLCFLPDSDRIVIGDGRGGVSVWDAAKFTLVQRYAGHTKLVSGITASPPDGKLIATASHDGTVKIWPGPQP